MQVTNRLAVGLFLLTSFVPAMRKSIATFAPFEIISHHAVADVWLNTSTNQYSLHAAVDLNPPRVRIHVAPIGPESLGFRLS